MTPTELIGHERAWRLLKRLADRGKLPAAVLLAGPPHVGKRTLASAFAARLLGCPDAAAALKSPDLLRISSEQETNSRDHMRDLLVQVAERPAVSRFRVVLVEDLDRADRTAIPLLLKAVEDAPRFARFLLTTAYQGRLPTTVASRSLVLALSRVPAAVVRTGLVERGVGAREAERLAELSGGRPGLALRLAADDRLRAQYEEWDAALSAGAAARVARLETREEAEEFLLFVQVHARGRQRMPVLRRAREALAMLAQNVPAPLVVDYVLASLP